MHVDEQPADHTQQPKAVRYNLIGAVTGAVSFPFFAMTHFAFAFPSMLIHVFILPVIIGMMVRWSIRLNYTPYRND